MNTSGERLSFNEWSIRIGDHLLIKNGSDQFWTQVLEVKPSRFRVLIQDNDLNEHGPWENGDILWVFPEDIVDFRPSALA